MQNYFQSIIPVLVFIFLGYFAKTKKLIDVDIARKLIKFLFTIPLPLLVFFSFATHTFDPHFLTLPLIAIILSSSLMLISYFIGKLLGMSQKRLGTLLVATGISSTLLYVLPLVASFYGQENTKYLFLYDFGNGLLAWTGVYYLAGRFGNKKSVAIQQTLVTFFKNPMIWALISGVIVGFLQFPLPPIVSNVTSQLGNFANPLLLLCVGIFLDPSFFKSKKHLAQLFLAAILVMGVSFFIAQFLTHIFNVNGIVQKIVIMCAVAPAGSLTVAFSAEHDLDLEFASALVAMTMVIGVCLIPILALL